jgi:7,8-dihydroneopterin aldolase/epimerase/oxygenase
MLTIGLKDVKFRAYHGVYASEQITGGNFILNLSVEYDTGKRVIDKLEETLNYEALFRMSKETIEKDVSLLEQVVMELAARILTEFSNVEQVTLSLEKCNPPIEQLNGSVFVKYDISRNAFLQKG